MTKELNTGEPVALKFPTMLRQMWSGGEVQAWLAELPPLYSQDYVNSLLGEIDGLKKSIVDALSWVQAWDRDKPYTDMDLCGEMVSIRLSGLCVLASAIGKREHDKLLAAYIQSIKVAPKGLSEEIDDALGIKRGEK